MWGWTKTISISGWKLVQASRTCWESDISRCPSDGVTDRAHVYRLALSHLMAGPDTDVTCTQRMVRQQHQAPFKLPVALRTSEEFYGLRSESTATRELHIITETKRTRAMVANIKPQSITRRKKNTVHPLSLQHFAFFFIIRLLPSSILTTDRMAKYDGTYRSNSLPRCGGSVIWKRPRADSNIVSMIGAHNRTL